MSKLESYGAKSWGDPSDAQCEAVLRVIEECAQHRQLIDVQFEVWGTDEPEPQMIYPNEGAFVAAVLGVEPIVGMDTAGYIDANRAAKGFDASLVREAVLRAKGIQARLERSQCK